MSSSATWKNFERKIGKDFGGKRHIRASYAESDEDIDGVKDFVIECKHRKVLNITEAVEQAELYNKRKYNSEKIPLAILQKSGTKQTIVALRLRHLRQLVKKGFPMDSIVEVNYKDIVAWHTKYRGAPSV